jgi:hypothetical protein
MFLQFNLNQPLLAEPAGIVADVERRLSVVEELEAVVIANVQRRIPTSVIAVQNSARLC